jgi:hypothetical protein
VVDPNSYKFNTLILKRVIMRQKDTVVDGIVLKLNLIQKDNGNKQRLVKRASLTELSNH